MIFRVFCISLFILLRSLGGFSQSSQRQDTIKMICREWKFKDGYSDNFSDKEAKDFMKSARLIFKSNMTAIFREDAFKEEFKWSYESSKRELILEMEDGKVRLKIVSLASFMMKFESTDPETKVFSSGILVPSN